MAKFNPEPPTQKPPELKQRTHEPMRHGFHRLGNPLHSDAPEITYA